MLLQIQKYNLNKLLQKYSFQHLRPPPQVMQIQIPKDQIFREIGNGQRKRHIFWRVQYTDRQNQALQQMKSQLHQNRIYQKMSNEIILKHLYATKFNQEQTFQRLLKLQQYHTNKIITKLTKQTIHRLEQGFIYSYGFDKGMRPILVVRADKLATSLRQNKDNKNKAEMQILRNFNCVYYLLLTVMNFKMMPYHSQKYVTIMDFNDMDFGEIPFMLLYDVFAKMNIYYCGNSQSTFIYNSKGIQKLWNIGKKLMSANALKNITFLQKGKQSQILNYVSQEQIQQKYGGSLQNLTKWWPPQSTNASFDEMNMSQISQQTAFYSVQNNTQFFIQTHQSTCGQNCSCQIY